MHSLHELQAAMADGIYTDRAPDARIGIKGGRFPPERYLQIYRNNVFASLTRALKDVYPVITRLVGDGFMAFASDSFIRQYPPRSGNLHDFGATFPAYLEEFPAARALAYLPDVARMEWAYHEAFHAAEANRDALMKLRTIDPDRHGELRFMLHPSARLIASTFPILRIWEVNQPAYRGDDRVNLDDGPAHVLVIRRGMVVELIGLSPGAFALLTAFACGASFEDACRRALAAESDFDLVPSFQTLVQDGTVVDIQLPRPVDTT